MKRIWPWERIVHPHDDQPAAREQHHKGHLEERSHFWGQLRWRFKCTCGSMSAWVRTEKYAEELLEVHHDIVLVDADLREALLKRARERRPER